jgi:hypothetical protein
MREYGEDIGEAGSLVGMVHRGSVCARAFGKLLRLGARGALITVDGETAIHRLSDGSTTGAWRIVAPYLRGLQEVARKRREAAKKKPLESDTELDKVFAAAAGTQEQP